MYFLALATDYDGTIAEYGRIRPNALEALTKLKSTGRRLLLVTGRELDALKHACPEIGIFDRVVAENGALIYDPATGRERLIAPPFDSGVVGRLIARNVRPLSVGRTIIATWEPHQDAVLAAIRETGEELQIIFNKGAIMVLPAGINKASGVRAALQELDIAARNVVAVGDAENDHAFLSACGCSAAVANAIPALKADADIVLRTGHGDGVAELIERILVEDAGLGSIARHGLLVGSNTEQRDVFIGPDQTVLIVGASGSGKSTFATLLTERIDAGEGEFCVLDPEGDYPGLRGAISLGDLDHPPTAAEVLKLLREVGVSLVVNTLALSLNERQRAGRELIEAVASLRSRTGRPHWLVIDEAHQVLPASYPDTVGAGALAGAILVTVAPDALPRRLLREIDVLLAFGPDAPESVARFAEARNLPDFEPIPRPIPGTVLVWSSGNPSGLQLVTIGMPSQGHRRHTGKYAIGDVGEGRSFYFRGLDNRTNVRAENLMSFLECAKGLEDGVWEYHLRRHDYSNWFRGVIKDDLLAREAFGIEADPELDPKQSRERIRRAILQRYAAPVHLA